VFKWLEPVVCILEVKVSSSCHRGKRQYCRSLTVSLSFWVKAAISLDTIRSLHIQASCWSAASAACVLPAKKETSTIARTKDGGL
jgi:hypothetical protein